MSDTTATLPPLFPAAGDPVLQRRAVEWSRDAKLLGGLHGWFKGAVLTYLVTDLIGASLNGALLWIYAQMESGVEFSETQLNVFDFLTGYARMIASWLFIASYLLAAFLFCRFIFRAIRNLDHAHAWGERMPASWAVGYNFIPIMNIWKPAQAMRQAWRGSLDPDRNRIDPPASMAWWWGCWLVSNWIANISFRLSMSSGAFSDQITDFDQFRTSLGLDIASSVIGAVSVVFLLVAIKPIVTAQDELTRKAKGGAA